MSATSSSDKKRLYLCHAQQRYGENTYIPLTCGVLWAYARTFPEVTAAYEMCGFLYLKEPVADAVARLDAPDAIALSIYIWNFEWSKQFAAAVKAKFPECVIIVGGVQVPDESPRILDENPNFDFAVYGEGEGAFKDFLVEHAKDEPDYASVGSLIWRGGGGISTVDEPTVGGVPCATVNRDIACPHCGAAEGAQCVAWTVAPHGERFFAWLRRRVTVNPRRAFVPLEELRSPYLDGVFDELWPREPRWQVLQEHDRGCGVGCHFCAWGQAALNKLRQFPQERVVAEFEWFGQHQAPYIDCCSANTGVLKRDADIARALVATKAKYGYPKTFRTSFAKGSNETVWEIANILSEADMLKSVTLALQSLDEQVLINIHRKNIKFDKFANLIKRYEDAGIPTYTEMILGLPGETLDTFLDGVERCLDAGQHSGLFTYMNSMLENTEQRKPEYIAAHGLVAVDMQAMLTHGTPSPDVVREIQRTIVATAAMPHSDWVRAYMHGKVVEIFHAQGLLQRVAIALHETGVRYRDFYGCLLDWCLANPQTVAGREVAGIERLLRGALGGSSWDCCDERLGDISWPPEEFAFARICLDLDRAWDELRKFTADFCDEERVAIGVLTFDDMWREQRADIAPPPVGCDTAAWAREKIWYGRKGAAAKLRKRASESTMVTSK